MLRPRNVRQMDLWARRRAARVSFAALCMLLAACSNAPTPVPTRLVSPPAVVVITPTAVAATSPSTSASAPSTNPSVLPSAAPFSATPLSSAAATPTGPLVTPPARPAPPSGFATPVPPATPVTATATPRTPTPTPDPNAPRALKVSADGCCPQPQWLPSGEAISFYGTATGRNGTATGLWSIPRIGGMAQLISGRYGVLSPDGDMIAYPQGTTTNIARLNDTIRVSWNTNGRVYISPKTGLAAWFTPAGDVKAASVSLDPPVRVVVGNIAAITSTTLPPSFSAERMQWFPDGQRLLISGRAGNGENPGLWVLDTRNGQATRIVMGRGLELPLISPDGKTIAYTATLHDDRSANGVWLVGADGSNPRRAPVNGGYRWSPDSTALYYVPLVYDRATDELWRYELADGSRSPVVSTSHVMFQIAQDEWELAPTGDAIVYRSAIDGALWIISWPK